MLRQIASTEKAMPPLRFLARQPIFDVHNHVHGYELLYREGSENQFTGNNDRAAQATLDSTLLFGINELTGKTKAFVNCTRKTIVEKLVTLLPPRITVLEILETIEPEPEVLKACAELREMGYKIALDDFVLRPGMEKLIDLADYIKVDFTASTPEERRRIRQRVTNERTALLAEKVETQEVFQAAVSEGFEYFQGYYFCRPVLLTNREIPPNRLNYLAILRALHRDPLDLHEVEDLVKQELSLCYRLLRLVNSALTGVREISSIMMALVAIGDRQFRKLATIAIAAELNDKQPFEILILALARGHFCELGAPIAGEDPDEQYLIGIFSLLPALLRLRMDDILPMLPLRPEVIDALNGEANMTRRLLGCLEQYEQGNWAECAEYCTAIGMSEFQVTENYARAIHWAEEALSLT